MAYSELVEVNFLSSKRSIGLSSGDGFVFYLSQFVVPSITSIFEPNLED